MRKSRTVEVTKLLRSTYYLLFPLFSLVINNVMLYKAVLKHEYFTVSLTLSTRDFSLIVNVLREFELTENVIPIYFVVK